MADQPPSPPANVGPQKPGESSAEYMNRLLAHIKVVEQRATEAERQKEEAKQRQEEAEQRAEEAKQQQEDERLLAKIELEREHQKERNTAQFAKMLQEELRVKDSQLQQHSVENSPQSLPAYLAQVSRLQAHAVRLLPQIIPGAISAHLQRLMESGGGSQSTSVQPTTSGRTDVVKKYYPLKLRPWVEFRDEVQRPGFARIYAALQESGGLPSRAWIQKDEETLLGQLPVLALNQKGGLNATRTHNFLNTVVLTPASRILNEYLNHGLHVSKNIFFDTAVQTSLTVFASVSKSSDNEESIKEPNSVLPDCLVLSMKSIPTAGALTTDNLVQVVAVAEHKPLHALRASSVSSLIASQLAEDQVIRLARQALVRAEKNKAKRLAKERARASTLTPASASTPLPVPEPEPELEQEQEPELPLDATSKTGKLDRLTYFSYALTQAFHYMFMAGVEFGYLASGEVIVFLRIPEDDATTLYYHVSLFPVQDTDNSDGANAPITEALTQAPYPAPNDAVDEDALADLPIAQMVSFCEYAMHAELRSSSWTVEQAARLAKFPNLPPGMTAHYGQQPSSQLGRRGRGGDSDGDGGGGGDDDNNGDDADENSSGDNRGEGHSQTTSSFQQHMSAQNPGYTGAVDQDISTTFLSTPCDLQTRPRPSRKVQLPTLPYCTHACLFGLAQNGPLDRQCPNFALHQAAKRGGGDNDTDNRHPLTSFELARRIRDQLFDTPETDCGYSVSHRGAVGYPFKLTLTGFGYTFVGKAVQDEHKRRLVHESDIYKALLPLQGSIIPVHLGLIELHVGYPILSQFLQLPYMMLLSYAGDSMFQSLIGPEDEEEKTISPEVAHLRAEAARTQKELARWGFEDEDTNGSNFRWCAETGRVMRIDFDRAYLMPSKRPLRVSTNLHASQPSQPPRSHASSDSATTSNQTPQTPLEKEHLADVAGKPLQEEPQTKRQKYDAHG